MMFDDSARGQQNPSSLHHMADVLIDNGYVVGQISKNRAEQKGECCFVALRNQMGNGHAVVVMEDNTIFDPEHKFDEKGGNFYAQCGAKSRSRVVHLYRDCHAATIRSDRVAELH